MNEKIKYFKEKLKNLKQKYQDSNQEINFLNQKSGELKVRKHLFVDQANLRFYSRLEEFHDLFVEQFLLGGVAKNNTHIEDIPFTKNPKFTLKYYEKIIGGLTNLKPSIMVKLIQEEDLVIECFFTDIRIDEDINNVYMVQNVMKWNSEKHFCCQVWKLFDTDVESVNDFWLY